MSNESQETTGGLGQQDEQAILDAVRSYPAAYQSGEVRNLLALWDAQLGEHVTYISVEKPTPTCGLEALRPYFQFLVDNYVVLGGEVRDVRISTEGPMAHVVCDILWSWDSKTGGAKVTIPARTSLLLRKRGERWLFQHIHESITWVEPKPA